MGWPPALLQESTARQRQGIFTRHSLVNRGTVFSGIRAGKNESETNSCMKMDLENHKALKCIASDSTSDYDLPFWKEFF